MKKLTVFSSVFILALSLLVGFKFVSASDSGCLAGDSFSRTTGQACNTTTATSTLQIGSRGDAVKAFQQTLKNAGFLSGKVDGIYGKMTSAAATNYYKIHSPVQPPVTPISTPVFTPTPITPSSASTCTNGYDSTTGFVCGCTSTSGYSTTTGNACNGSVPSTVVGCTTTSGYSSTNGDPCDGSGPIRVTATNLWWFDSTHPTCAYKSFFGEYMYQGLQTFTTQADCQSHLPSATSLLPGCTSTSGYDSFYGLPCDPSYFTNTPSNGTIIITSASPLPNAKVGVNYRFTPQASSTTETSFGFIWAVSRGLPPGILLSEGMELVGTPTKAGAYTFSLLASKTQSNYGSNYATKQFTLTVDPATTSLLPGCTSTSGFSSTTGDACDGSTPVTSTPVSTCTTSGFDPNTGFRCGCSSMSGWSSTTGNACDGSVPSTVAGCSITSGYSTTSGLACDGSGKYNPNFPGCTPVSIFNPLNGEYCPGKAPTPTPPVPTCTAGNFDPTNGFKCGCSSISGFSSKDGSSCAVN
jgi:hypothetical protein